MKYIILIVFIIPLFVKSQNVKKIELINADMIDYDEARYGKNVRRMVGNVTLKHENAILTCDSAFYNTEQNDVQMYGEVNINFSDTIHLHGKYISYSGNQKTAKVRKDVTLIHKRATLYCDSLNYDRNTSVAYYFNYGKIVSNESVLVSKWGYYFAQLRDFVAVRDVILTNPKYKMYSDSLRYNIQSGISTFYGPSKIISDTNLIYCENGWYDTKKDISRFSKNAYLWSKKKLLKGDSLFYDRGKQYGIATKNVSLIDSTNQLTISGNYGRYYENPDKAFMTDSALFVAVQDSVDTMYLHADTLFYLTTIDSLKYLKAYYHVKMFKNDLQGSCDSLVYSVRDSVMEMFKVPILWSEQHQLTAKQIKIFFRNDSIHRIYLNEIAFIISHEDSTLFNQIKGKTMTGYFKNNKLYKVDVKGNGQTIYYPKDNNEIIGANKAESSDLTIFIENNEVKKIVFFKQPNATLFPLNQINANEFKLDYFKWYENIRPLNALDIFKK
ncbi:MAG TPA: OstA-like protein [Bacteroidales bacterium]|nr:OstA-like protein [Bacteroidales bacterium]